MSLNGRFLKSSLGAGGQLPIQTGSRAVRIASLFKQSVGMLEFSTEWRVKFFD